ncbi:hypothetical protein D9M68_458630 [compost metagenome]
MNGNDERLTFNGQPYGRHDSVCSPEAFAEMCGVSVETVTGWLQSGTVPAVNVAGSRLVNIERLRADLEQGKDLFAEGDYAND